MAVTQFTRKVICVDDEPQNIIWLTDYLENKGYELHVKTNLSDGLVEMEKGVARAIIVDLNIPLGAERADTLVMKGVQYSRYPGLYLADRARNFGYRGRQVIVYSVHDDAEVRRVTENMMCTYLLKGRPRTFKAEMESVLEFDPTQQT